MGVCDGERGGVGRDTVGAAESLALDLRKACGEVHHIFVVWLGHPLGAAAT